MENEVQQEKDTFLEAAWRGLREVLVVAWTVPAARNWLATQLLRLGLPSTLIAIGVAIGDKLAQ